MSIPPKPAYQLSTDKVIQHYDTNPTGLTGVQAQDRYGQHGPNALVDIRPESLVRRYLRQFQDWMIALLLGSGTVAAYLGDVRTAVVLAALVVFNTLIGFL